jgi:transposase
MLLKAYFRIKIKSEKMANKKTDMSKVRKTIVLYHQGRDKSFISRYLQISRTTVQKYINLLKVLNLDMVQLNQKSDAELEQLFSTNLPGLSPKLQAVYDFFPYMEKELKKTGVTKQLMWEEYFAQNPDGLRSSQFMDRYMKWAKKVNPVMHMEHKAGDKLFIDYAGKKLSVVDKTTGEITEVEFFVAILGSSQYTYAEASPTQQKEDLVKSVENALQFYGGVPAAIVPDNLKSAVTKSNRFEPTLNETFLDFAEHYGTAVLPARAYKPRDKSLVEGAVRILYQRIYTALRNRVFHGIEELNRAVWDELGVHNNMKLTGRHISRLQMFNDVEKEALMPLPQHHYEIKYQAIATVGQNGHVQLSKDKHYYSVPYQNIRKKVKLLYTSDTVEIYHKYNRIAVHKRSFKPYNYTTVTEHMASSHQFMTEWTPQRFINWGATVDEPVKEFITRLLEQKLHPEQAYKSCLGVLSFAKKVGNERLSAACKRAVDYNIYNYQIIQTILQKGLDTVNEPEDENPQLPCHANIRGDKYYN